MEQLINQSISRYKLVTLLGEGGMGAVFKAFDVTLQRDVAIKVMHLHFARQPNFQERFLQEARTAARLNHAGIVQVYDFGQDKGQLFIVMKFIAGRNLEKVLEALQLKKEVLPLPEALDIVWQVSEALDYAHKQGVLHRDIKPANIMIEPVSDNLHAFRPVLTDLGLAKLAEGGMMTMEGTSMGTPAYMSPEQSLGQKTDPRSDVYSLGVLLFELTTGRRPFPAGSLTEAIRYHTQEAPPKPTSLRPDLPAAVEQVILKAMEKDPARRFSSAGELAAAIKLAGEGVPAVKNAPTSAATAISGPEVPVGGLATQFSSEAPDARGDSMFNQAPNPGPARQDRIQLLAKDGASRMISIDKPALTLGRGEDNDIVLADTQASRHHARIEFAEGKARVVDLNSTNGTYLDGARLLPGIAEAWTPEKPLRIGDTALRLVRGEEGLPDTRTAVHRRDQPFSPAGSMAQPGSAGAAPVGEARISLSVDHPGLTLTPGQTSSLTLTLFNQGSVVDHFRVAVEGTPARWLAAQPTSIQLMPGARQTVTLNLQPPRSPESRAGRYPLVVRATSQDNPNQMAEVRLTLTVAPFAQFSTELFPQRLNAGRTGRLTVRNTGNTQETFNLAFTDRADELSFEPPSQQVRVAEGQVGSAEFRARPKQRRLLGGSQQHPFTARISHTQGETQTQNGELVSRALIPTWVLPLLGLIVMLLVAGGGLAYNAMLTQARQATATAEGVTTAIAAVVAETATAVQQETELAGANQITQAAATQNAILQGTADFSSTQLAALQQTGTQAALDAANAQNAATTTALAGQVLTLQADQANQAATATMAYQLTSQAATTQANIVVTTAALDNQAAELDFLTGTWVNPSPVKNQLTRLIIEKVDDSTVSFHAFNECSPDDCDLGTNDKVAFTLPTTEGSVGTGGRGLILTFTRTLKVTRAANRKDLDVTVEVYSLITRTKTTYYYTFEQELFIRPILIP